MAGNMTRSDNILSFPKLKRRAPIERADTHSCLRKLYIINWAGSIGSLGLENQRKRLGDSTKRYLLSGDPFQLSLSWRLKFRRESYGAARSRLNEPANSKGSIFIAFGVYYYFSLGLYRLLRNSVVM